MVVTTAAAETRPQTRTVRYAPAPTWVIPPPAASEGPQLPGAPVRLAYMDQQVRISVKGQENYQAYRIKVLAPEALAAGNITVAWSPTSEELTVHRLTIIRDGKTIDVLAAQKFAVLQRENNLEQAMLDGNLTATLQAAGLQLGDELEFAATTLSLDANLGERPQGFMQFPVMGIRGTWRLRVLEPKAHEIAYEASLNLPPVTVRDAGPETERVYLLSDPASAIIPEGAPRRYALTRLVQYSSYPDWATVSRTFDPLFAAAAVLPRTSPVKQEAARIAATTTDPVRRAEAALRTVQDRIRYVYVGLDGGNYRPSHADATWERRFGDCKAKTTLLVALLRELDIAAEPVLVATSSGDGIDQWLPTPAMFDHVVVRATVSGQVYWLDGTRLGDRKLADLEPPASRWGLPLRAAGAALEPIPTRPPLRPQLIQAVEIDATAGFEKPGKYRVQHTLRGDEIFGVRAQLAGVAAADADRMVAAYWRKQFSDVEPTRTSWRFDDDNRLLVLGMEGEGKVEWEGDAKDGRTHYLFGGGFPPPAEMKRPKDQPQDAAWATDYPAFTCYATRVKVPRADKGFRWSYSAKPVDRLLGGVAYWRISQFDGGMIRIVRSRRVNVIEISAAEAASVNGAIAGFDNNKSYVFETGGKIDVGAAGDEASFGSFEDFAGANPPCQGRAGSLATKVAGG